MFRSVLNVTVSLSLLIVLLCFAMGSPTIAFNPDFNEPYGSLGAARRHGALVAEITPVPANFEFEGLSYSIREAWIQESKDKKWFQLCFRLKKRRDKSEGILDFKRTTRAGLLKSVGSICGGIPWNCVYDTELEKDLPLESEYQLNFYGKFGSMGERKEPLQSFRFIVHPSDRR